jgi:hypothetical protein
VCKNQREWTTLQSAGKSDPQNWLHKFKPLTTEVAERGDIRQEKEREECGKKKEKLIRRRNSEIMIVKSPSSAQTVCFSETLVIFRRVYTAPKPRRTSGRNLL